jgi:26S proteasome regulatory subunit N5
MLARAILEISHDALDWKALNNNILVLCKRRAQLKQVVQLVVEVAMSYIPELENDTEGLVVLLETLRQVRVHIGCLEGETLTLYK